MKKQLFLTFLFSSLFLFIFVFAYHYRGILSYEKENFALALSSIPHNPVQLSDSKSEVIETPHLIVVIASEITAPVSVPVNLNPKIISPDKHLFSYLWDFGDGTIIKTSNEQIFHSFTSEGIYKAQLSIKDIRGKTLAKKRVKIVIKSDVTKVTQSSSIVDFPSMERRAKGRRSDGVTRDYYLLIDGSPDEERFWKDVSDINDFLVDSGVARKYITILAGDYYGFTGFTPSNPEIISKSVTNQNIADTFLSLANTLDQDDNLHIWFSGHGGGYTEKSQTVPEEGINYGWLDGDAVIDPNLPEFKEKDFVLKGFSKYGQFRSQMGLGVWQTEYNQLSDSKFLLRKKMFSATYKDIFISSLNKSVSNNGDKSIKSFFNFMEGDINKDGFIDFDAGEYAYKDNKNKKPHFDTESFDFTDKDWGVVDEITDDLGMGTGSPFFSACDNFKFYDKDMNNHLNLACDFAHKGVFKFVATDKNNNGFFNGVDVNGDGDFNDMVSIRQNIQTGNERMYDYEFSRLVDLVKAKKIGVLMFQCHSGGFINNLSRKNRVIMTAAAKGQVSWGNYMPQSVIEQLKLRPKNSYLDLFVKSNIFQISEQHWYDDNGDKKASISPTFSRGLIDGVFGSGFTFLGNSAI